MAAREGAERVSVLDIDYHHGNGTQAIFYARGDVQVVNIHADPIVEYPYFLGHADERGTGAGEGFNLNLPLPHGTGFDAWSKALAIGCAAVAGFAPAALVVSLGVDTFGATRSAGSGWRRRTTRRSARGSRALGLPTLFVMEGGYAVEAIGVNAVGVLTGFEAG